MVIGQVFQTLMGLWPLLNTLSGAKVMKNALLLYSLLLLLLLLLTRQHKSLFDYTYTNIDSLDFVTRFDE